MARRTQARGLGRQGRIVDERDERPRLPGPEATRTDRYLSAPQPSIHAPRGRARPSARRSPMRADGWEITPPSIASEGSSAAIGTGDVWPGRRWLDRNVEPTWGSVRSGAQVGYCLAYLEAACFELCANFLL